MAETVQEERWRWVKPVVQEEMRLVDVAKVCPHSIRSLKRWKKAYDEHGVEGLVPKSTEPKTQPHETPIHIKEMVIALRKQTKLCAQKLHWRLKKQGVSVPVRTIGKILKKEGLTRTYRTKKVRYDYLRAERRPGELIEIDVKYVPGPIHGRRYYQYTAIDTASRWRHLEVFDEQCSFHSVVFLQIVQKRFPYAIEAIKTDNHSTFTNRHVGGLAKRSDMSPAHQHTLDVFCAEHNIIHYLIDPGKPAQNGTVERSHREDQEKFYAQHTFRSVTDLRQKLRRWNDAYNDLEHCSLGGKTPNEVLLGVPEVCA